MLPIVAASGTRPSAFHAANYAAQVWRCVGVACGGRGHTTPISKKLLRCCCVGAAVVLARLLYLVADWRGLLQESKYVLKRGGTLFHEWGNGDASEPWVQVREKARSLFEEAGIAAPFHPGARSEAEVDSCLRNLGFLRKTEIEAGAGPAITLAEFLKQGGEFSYIWNVPKDVQAVCLPRLRNWCECQFDLHQPATMPAELHWVAYENAT